MVDDRTRLLAQFYEQCQEKGYSDMGDEAQSLKAKVIAKDLGLPYGRIAKLYDEAAKAADAVKADEARQKEEAKRLAVDGELLFTAYKADSFSPNSPNRDAIWVYRRPDGSIYSTYNNGPKIEGKPDIVVKEGGYTSFIEEPVQTSYVGTTVGNSTVINGMTTGGGIATKKQSTGTGYLEISADRRSFEIGEIVPSPQVCDAFKRDPEFIRLNGQDILFWNYEGKRKADTLRSNSAAVQNSAAAVSMFNQAQDVIRLPHWKCGEILTLIQRILNGQYPPSDETLYNEAAALASSRGTADLKKAYEIFTEISDYKDAASQAEKLRPKYEDIVQTEKENDILKREKIKKIALISAAASVAVILLIVLISSIWTNSIKKRYAQALSDAKPGYVFTFGSFEQDNDLTNGAEPIEWIIVSKSNVRIVMISRSILSYQEFDDAAVCDWFSSDLREYLNKSFYKTAFTSTEQKALVKHAVSSTLNPQAQVQDKIFLLSEKEAMSAKSHLRDCAPTTYAASQVNLYPYYQSAWWVGSLDVRTVKDWLGRESLTSSNIYWREDTVKKMDGNQPLGIRPAIEFELN